MSKTSLHTLIKTKENRIISNYKDYLKHHPKSEPTKLIIQEGILSSLTCPIIVNSVCTGAMIFSCKHSDSYTENHSDMARLITNSMAATLEKNTYSRTI